MTKKILLLDKTKKNYNLFHLCKKHRFKIILILLSVSIILNMVLISNRESLMYEIERQSRKNSDVLYINFWESLEEFHSVIMEMDKALTEIETNNNQDSQYLIETIDRAVYRLKDASNFITYSSFLNRSFDFYLSYFYQYLKDLSYYGHENTRILDEDIAVLRKIVDLEKKLIPSIYTSQDKNNQYIWDISPHYYYRLIFKENNSDDYPLYASELLKNTLNEIEEISTQASKVLSSRIE